MTPLKSLCHVIMVGLALMASVLMAGQRVAHAESPDYKITILPGGTEMEYSGQIEVGSSGALREALDQNNQVKVLHLKSNGGNVFFGRQMQNLVHERGLTTVVDANCMSACALVFLGGRERYLAAGAELGFHRASAAGTSQFEIDSFEESDAQFMRAIGISDAFVERAFSTPSTSIWVPTVKELEQAHVINGVSASFRTPEDARSSTSLAEQMLTMDPFRLLASRDPALFAAIRQQAVADMGSKDSLGDIDPLPVSELSPLALGFFSQASDTLALEFARSFESYLVRLGEKNPDECYYLFFPKLAPAGFESSEILAPSEFAAFADLQARLIGYAARHKTPLPAEADIEAAKVTLLDQFQQKRPDLLAVFSDIDARGIDHGQACSAMTELLALVLLLPDKQSGPLLRFIYQ